MEAGNLFLCIFMTTVILFGVAGNTLSFMTWSVGKRCKHLPVSSYFKPLAIIDTFILLVPALEYLVSVTPPEVFLRNTNDGLCKLFWFASSSSFRLSMWITVVLSIEKACRLYMPFRFTNRDPYKRIYASVILLALISFGINASFLCDSVVVKFNDETEICIVSADSFTFKYILPFTIWCDIFSVYILPIIILIICNVMILVNMFKRSQNTVGNLNDERQTRRQTQLKYATYQVIAVSVIHCMTTIPHGVLMTTMYIYSQTGVHVTSTIAFTLFAIFQGVRYLNNAINFILYCSIGSDFRQDFKDLLACCRG